MVGTMTVSKKLLDHLRAAFKRYGNKVLGDPDVTINFLPTEFDGYFEVLLTSPQFEKMEYTERQNSIWKYLRSDPEVTNDDLLFITRIATGTEAVEFI
ncbi:MAG: hypothetical protein ACRENG_32570 [bacterium]